MRACSKRHVIDDWSAFRQKISIYQYHQAGKWEETHLKTRDEGGAAVSHPVFEAVRIPALFATQVNEEVRSSRCVLWGHVPHNAEGVAGHLTDLDIAGCGKGGVHCCQMPLKPRHKKHERV